MGLAANYYSYLGIGSLSAEDFKKELFKNGLDISISASRDMVNVKMSGLQESFDKGIELLENYLYHGKADQTIYTEYVKDILKSRKNAKLNKGTILQGALKSYAMYGPVSPFTDVISEQDLNKINPEKLVQKIKDLSLHKHRIFYYGPASQANISSTILAKHALNTDVYAPKEPKVYTFRSIPSSEVFFTEFNMVQSEMLFLSRAADFNKDMLPYTEVFNQYFGLGLSSIVFQEIRESKALAYSANNNFVTPGKKDVPFYNVGYIGTQADKLPEALSAMNVLLKEMPKSEKQYHEAKSSVVKLMESDRTTKTSIFWSYERIKKLGLADDYRKEMYQQIKKMNLEELDAFFSKYIKGKPTSYLIIGKKENLNFKEIEKLGPVKELSLEEIFGY